MYIVQIAFFLSFSEGGGGEAVTGGGGGGDAWFFAGIDKDIEAGCKCEMNKQVGSLLQGPKWDL